MGDLRQARRYLYEALQMVAETHYFEGSMLAVPLAALLLADQGDVERAVELYVLASRYPFVANARWFEDIAGRYTAAAAASLPSEVVAAAEERGRARGLWATAEELLTELKQSSDDTRLPPGVN